MTFLALERKTRLKLKFLVDFTVCIRPADGFRGQRRKKHAKID
jgi:hypothetical protein